MSQLRPTLSNKKLSQYLIAWLLSFGFCATFLWMLPDIDFRPGAPFFQMMAILGSLLLLSPFVYALAKRSGRLSSPNAGLIGHIKASLVGSLFIALHALPSFWGYPAFILAALLGLIVTGFVGRRFINDDMAASMGAKLRAFRRPDPEIRAKLARLIEAKTTLLNRLDKHADEALFSPSLNHWLRSPFLTLRYLHLVQKENSLMGVRRSVPFRQAWWRPLHMTLALLFGIGLITHVITALFLPHLIHEGPIYWWHFS